MAPFTCPAPFATYPWVPVNVGAVYAGSALLTPVLARSGCVIVLVGHCTLKDCDVAGITATNMNTDRYRSVPAFLLDIRSPPSLITTPRSCALRRFATSAKINPRMSALIVRAQRD